MGVIPPIGSESTRGAAVRTLRSMKAGSECCLRDFQKGVNQSSTQRGSIPKEAYVPTESVVRDRQFPQRQTFRPRRCPIGYERPSQAAIDHDGDRLEPIEFKSLLRPKVSVTEIAVNKASSPARAVQSNEGLRGQGNMRIADRCRCGG